MTTSEKLSAGMLVLVLGVLGASWWQGQHQPASLAMHDSLVADRPRVDAVIAEHADSARERVKIVYVGQDAAKRSVLVAAAAVARADSLAVVATTVTELRVAYDSLHRGYDSLRVAMRHERKNTENALAASAFWQLAYLADSTARHAGQQDADRLATDLRRATGRRWTDYVAVGCGVGFKGPDCYAGVRVPLGR